MKKIKYISKKTAREYLDSMWNYRNGTECDVTLYFYKGELLVQPKNGNTSTILFNGEQDMETKFSYHYELSDCITIKQKVDYVQSFINNFIDEYNEKFYSEC